MITTVWNDNQRFTFAQVNKMQSPVVVLRVTHCNNKPRVSYTTVDQRS